MNSYNLKLGDKIRECYNGNVVVHFAEGDFIQYTCLGPVVIVIAFSNEGLPITSRRPIKSWIKIRE